MPEGHSIHRLANDHRRYFENQSMIVTSPQGRFSKEAKRLSGKTLVDVFAHGKHLFYEFAGVAETSKPVRVHIHLGLYGKFRLHKNPAPEPRGAVRVRMIGEERSFDLNGPNCCEIISAKDYKTLKARLGQDPLQDDADPEMVWQRISRSRAAIGRLLLDQSVFAGVGNIFRAEILYQMGIHPERAGRDLSREEFDGLWELTVKLMQIGVKYNRIITVDRDEVDKPLSRLNRSERLLCYKKDQCQRCLGNIRCWSQSNRKIYACAQCQV